MGSKKCSYCKKKLGVVNYDCKCSEKNRFCGKCRMPELHECNYDFNGAYKGYNFDIQNFIKFKDKIIYIKLDLSKEIHLVKNNGWLVHDRSRDAIINSLEFVKDEDIVIHSDADEIPNLENIDFQNIKNKIYIFEQKIFYFKFNLQDTSHSWNKSKMCKRLASFRYTTFFSHNLW